MTTENRHPSSPHTLSDFLLRERETKGIRLSIYLRLTFMIGTLAAALITGQNRSESITTAGIALIFVSVNLILLFLMTKKTRTLLIGSILSISDVIAVSLVALAFYQSTVLFYGISSGYIIKSVVFIIALVFIIINSIMSHPMYPLLCSSGMVISYTIIFLFVLSDPKTIVTYNFVETYNGPGVNPYRFAIELFVMLTAGAFLSIMSYQYRKAIMAASSYEQHIHEQDKKAVIGELATGMMHEINNQMLSISLLEFIKQKLPEKDKRIIDIVFDCRKRIIDIMNEIRALIRDEAIDYRFEPHSLRSIIEEVITIIKMDPESHNVHFSYDGSDCLVHIDKNKIFQVFLNILKNSLQAIGCKDGGSIIIMITDKDPVAEISITDNGKGISPDRLKKMWMPFYTTKGRHGIGIGLAITKRIIEGHSGSIECSSKDGVGTSFIFTLPSRRDQTFDKAI